LPVFTGQRPSPETGMAAPAAVNEIAFEFVEETARSRGFSFPTARHNLLPPPFGLHPIQKENDVMLAGLLKSDAGSVPSEQAL